MCGGVWEGFGGVVVGGWGGEGGGVGGVGVTLKHNREHKVSSNLDEWRRRISLAGNSVWGKALISH